VLLAATAFGGCGPAISSYVILSAEAQLDGARAAGADKLAIYEYTSAREYLHKAREEQGYADFGAAIDFATKAEELARKSTERAAALKEAPALVPSSTEPVVPSQGRPGTPPRVIIERKDGAPKSDAPSGSERP